MTYEPFDDDDALVHAARPVIASATRAAGDARTRIALTDARGVIAHQWASLPGAMSQFAEGGTSAGLVLREAIAGTNGVGLAILTKRPQFVRGSEHFSQRWLSIACLAGPVMHPLTRELLGVVNVTAPHDESAKYLRVLLHALVTGIQHALGHGARLRDQRLADAHMRVRQAVHAPVVTLDDERMIVESGVCAAALDRELLWELANRAGPLATVLELPNGQRFRLIPTEPGTLAEGFSLVLTADAVDELAKASPVSSTVGRDSLSPLDKAEYDVIVETLRRCGGNKTTVAVELKISRGTLYERLRRYGITAQ